jgi:ATP-dependent Clp protease protease subunit
MLHQPSGGAQGQASDIAIVAEEILKTRSKLNTICMENTGQSLDHVEKVMERDTWMTAEEALAFGIIDKVIEKKSDEDNQADQLKI